MSAPDTPPRPAMSNIRPTHQPPTTPDSLRPSKSSASWRTVGYGHGSHIDPDGPLARNETNRLIEHTADATPQMEPRTAFLRRPSTANASRSIRTRAPSNWALDSPRV